MLGKGAANLVRRVARAAEGSIENPIPIDAELSIPKSFARLVRSRIAEGKSGWKSWDAFLDWYANTLAANLPRGRPMEIIDMRDRLRRASVKLPNIRIGHKLETSFWIRGPNLRMGEPWVDRVIMPDIEPPPPPIRMPEPSLRPRPPESYLAFPYGSRTPAPWIRVPERAKGETFLERVVMPDIKPPPPPIRMPEPSIRPRLGSLSDLKTPATAFTSNWITSSIPIPEIPEQRFPSKRPQPKAGIYQSLGGRGTPGPQTIGNIKPMGMFTAGGAILAGATVGGLTSYSSGGSFTQGALMGALTGTGVGAAYGTRLFARTGAAIARSAGSYSKSVISFTQNMHTVAARRYAIASGAALGGYMFGGERTHSRGFNRNRGNRIGH